MERVSSQKLFCNIPLKARCIPWIFYLDEFEARHACTKYEETMTLDEAINRFYVPKEISMSAVYEALMLILKETGSWSLEDFRQIAKEHKVGLMVVLRELDKIVVNTQQSELISAIGEAISGLETVTNGLRRIAINQRDFPHAHQHHARLTLVLEMDRELRELLKVANT